MSLKNILFFILFSLCCASIAVGQPPQSTTSSDILLQLKKLKVLGSVLYIAAHPDDENTTLLSYLTNEKLYRTAYLSLTRGDGGQNLIGDEQGAELGLIRTQELLAARKIDGAEQFFTSAYDFGYSKSPDEALSIWNHDKILSEVVWIIRKFQPDVIICRFPKTGEGGHGQHTASAILAEEAFEAAADSTKFREQLKIDVFGNNLVSTWKAKSLLWNTFNFGSINTQKENQFKLDAGGYNSLLGKSYGEIAAQSRSQHKSQGFGVSAQRGSLLEYFASIKGTVPVKELFDDIDSKWSRLGFGSIENEIDTIIHCFNYEHPENSLKALCELYQSVSTLKGDSYWKRQKLKQIQQIIALCGGWFAEVLSDTKQITPGDSIHLKFVFNNRVGAPIEKASYCTIGNAKIDVDSFPKNKPLQIKRDFKLSDTFTHSQPYWLKNELSRGMYNITDPDFLTTAYDPLAALLEIRLYGQIFHYSVPLVFKRTDPIKGEIYEPVSVIPALSITPEQTMVLNNHKNKSAVQLDIHAFSDIVIHKILVNNEVCELGSPLKISKSTSFKKLITIHNEVNNIKLIASNHTYDSELREIHYDHIPDITFEKKASIVCKSIDLKIAGNKIGYIKGAGDKVPEILKQMGYEVQFLEKKDIIATKLTQFDAIITGVRAYNTNEWLNDVYIDLMEYIRKGGVLLVQYNTNNQIGPLKAKIGPFPFDITKNRITDENATVVFSDLKNEVFNFPNRISSKDFENWVQERSIYHAKTTDSHFEKLLKMNDPQELADDGSLLLAHYGKGRFIYTGLSFFRQLPAGVTGAIRLFANLIANRR